MNGGAGNDTAVYAARAADYQLSFLGGNARVSDLRAGAPDGTDTLRAIENLELVDATLAILSGTDGDDGFTAAGNQVIAGGAGTDTITFGFRLVDATITWLGHSVMIQTASSHTVLGGFDIYVFTDGTVQNNDADILVDDLFYYANNHDVWAAQADADQHYHQTGRHALRDPNAFFDTSLYLDAYSDVKVAGVDPLLHFAGSGWQEGRIPSLAFDPRQYRDANPDVASAQVDPLAHFLRFGVPEERLPFAPTTLIGASGFDYVFYLQSNPDVAAADVDPLAHFRSIGWREGRDPNALFDVEGYRAAYADVAAAGVDPLDHYNQFGWREGRDPSGAFDTRFYLDTHADVAAAQVNPLQHYLQFGVHEGRAILSDGVFG